MHRFWVSHSVRKKGQLACSQAGEMKEEKRAVEDLRAPIKFNTALDQS